MDELRSKLKDKKRVVVKIGSSSLQHPETGDLDYIKMDILVRELCNIRNQGKDVILVTSGAIACGRRAVHISKPATIAEKQACAAIGQARLMMIYQKLFAEYNQTIAQILITKRIMLNEISKANAENTFAELLRMEVIPIVNENDPISTDQIQEENFGDNDTLSANVAELVKADLLILLSDIDGLYDRDPRRDPDAKLIETVPVIDARILSLAGDKGSELATGGMVTKLHAAQIATAAGCEMVIANGEKPEVLYDIVGGKRVGTRFLIPKSEEELL